MMSGPRVLARVLLAAKGERDTATPQFAVPASQPGRPLYAVAWLGSASGPNRNEATTSEAHIMDTHELAGWIRKEHERVDEITHTLRDRAGVVPRANVDAWIKEVSEAFEHFRAHLMRHMALEEHEGYMTGVVQRRPALAEVVERLRHEHQEITALMNGLHTSLENLGPDQRLLLRDASRRIHDLIHIVEQHEADENLMLTSAFTNDIGTKD